MDWNGLLDQLHMAVGQRIPGSLALDLADAEMTLRGYLEDVGIPPELPHVATPGDAARAAGIAPPAAHVGAAPVTLDAAPNLDPGAGVLPTLPLVEYAVPGIVDRIADFQREKNTIAMKATQEITGRFRVAGDTPAARTIEEALNAVMRAPVRPTAEALFDLAVRVELMERDAEAMKGELNSYRARFGEAIPRRI